MAAITNFQSVISTQSVGTGDVDKLASSFDKLSASIEATNAKSKKLSTVSFDSFAANVKAGIQDPLGSVASIAEKTLKSLGPVGAGVAGVGVVLAAAAVASYSFAKSLGAMADEIEDTAYRMGITVQQAQEFRFAMKYAGGDIGTLEGVMRKLSQEIEDGGENLQKYGIKFRDARTGAILPMSEVLLEVARRLGSIDSVTERNVAGITILGKSALAVLPDLLALPEGIERARQLSTQYSKQELQSFDEMHKRITEFDERWDHLATKLKAGIAIPLLFILGDGKNAKEPLFQSNALDFARQKQGPAPNRILEAVADFLLDSQFESIRRNDARVKAAREGSPDNQEQLTRAKKKLEELQKSLKTQVVEDVNETTFKEIDQQKRVIAAIEARIEATKRLEAAEKSLQSFERQAAQAGQGPVERIFTQRDELVSQGANKDRAGVAAIKLALPELAKETAAANKALFDLLLKDSQYWQKEWEDVVFKPLDKNSSEQVKKFLAAMEKAAQVRKELRAIEVADEKDEVARRSSSAIGFLGIAAGPNDELALIQAVHAQKLRDADELFAIEEAHAQDLVNLRKAEAEQRRAIGEADIERELKIGELVRRRLDTVRNLGASFFDAALGGAGGIQRFAQNLLLDQGRKIAGNFAVEIFGKASANIGLPNKIFQGTLLGKDPLKDVAAVRLAGAGDQLQLAAAELIAAARSLALSPSGGGGGVASAARNFSSAAGTFASLGIPGDADIYNLPLDRQPSYRNTAFTPGFENVNGGVDFAAGSGSKFTALKGVGIAGAAAGGAFGVYSGIKTGGVRGAATAASSLAGAGSAILTLAGVSGPAAPILAGVGLALSLIPQLLGDPKQKRREEIDSFLQARRFEGPEPVSIVRDVYGRDISYDARGNLRPITVINNNTTNNVSAIDSQDVARFFEKNSAAVNRGVARAIEDGGELVPKMASALGLQ